MRPLIGGLAYVGLKHNKARSLQLGTQVIYWPAIRGGNSVIESLNCRSLEEPDEQRTSGFEDPAELQ